MAGKKKDFSTVNTGSVYSAITEATAEPAQEYHLEHIAQAEYTATPQNPRAPYTAQQVEAMRQAGTTQGRKGCRQVRINMAFTPEIHEYIKVMARVRGESVTQFTNYVFRQSMEQNAELYAQAQQFAETFK